MESWLHSDLKNDLYISLLRNGYDVEKEKKLSRNCRPDLTLRLNGNTIAIELQKSPLSPSAILERMRRHTKAGAYTLWLVPEQILSKIIHRKRWCEAIQEISDGCVLMPTMGSEVVPARIENLYGSTKKFIDKYERRVEIDELILRRNEHLSVNVVGWNDWWVEGRAEFMDITS